MKTYAEIQGEPPFNWFNFLSQENISSEEWQDAKIKSSSWVTCACGNQCSIIPRSIYGAPLDNELEALGGGQGFHGAIELKLKGVALEYLKLIEKRSAYLIKNINEEIEREIMDHEEEIKRLKKLLIS